MPASLRQVAEEAAVSQATASRVLSGHGAELFAPETRRRIEEVARQLGYRPNHTARALATGRTGLMTLWSYPPYQTFFGLVMAEMQRQAQQAGIGLLVADISAPGNRPFVTQRGGVAQRRHFGDGLRRLGERGPRRSALGEDAYREHGHVVHPGYR